MVAVKQNRAVFQFTVTLRNIHPPIWRRIQVWEDARLSQLHGVLQIVMGWEDCHLYEFPIGGNIYAVPGLDDERKIIDVKRTRVHDVVQRVGTEVEYVYDLGDYWEHDLLLEDILQPAPDIPYPRCIAGERNCPPEDVGGAGGYEDYTALRESQHGPESGAKSVWSHYVDDPIYLSANRTWLAFYVLTASSWARRSVQVRLLRRPLEEGEEERDSSLRRPTISRERNGKKMACIFGMKIRKCGSYLQR